MPRRVSQTQLAKELGVSQALVSLVLNGRKEGINAETYQRIWDHAVSCGYQPRGMKFERLPRRAMLRQVGIILRSGLNIHTQGSYFNHVLHGLHTVLAEQGHAAVFLGSEDGLKRARLRQYFPTGHALQGVVLFGEVKSSFLRLLQDFVGNIVAVSARHTGHCHSVVGNEPQALAAIVKHLHDLGHRRIGWLGGNAGLGRHESRHQAYVEALKLHHLAADERYAVYLQQGDRAEGSEAILKLLPLRKNRDFPTAFITYNLHMAIGAAQTLEREGLSVPGAISVAAADYSPLAREVKPHITAAGCEAERLGDAAGKLIMDSARRDDGWFQDLILPAELYLGQSTGPAA
ncbi:MAG: LacI family DNA-binding transcriptional regulator [Opitutaceae bacterium]